MNLETIVDRDMKPEPWAEGDNIPWNRPDFSKRMLAEHLSQAHNAASRRFEIIDQHVQWIHRNVLSEQPSRILDLGCGPGLYAQRLAALGHRCTGIDYSPASIAYARDEAERRLLDIHYRLSDIRTVDFPGDQDLVMLIYGELNVFSASDAKCILSKAHDCLADTGQLLLEVHARGVIPTLGRKPRTWYTSKRGLWSGSPHICLQESFWDAARQTATTRYLVVDAATGDTTLSSASYQDYSDDEYGSLLAEAGFGGIVFYPSLRGAMDDEHKDFRVMVAGRA